MQYVIYNKVKKAYWNGFNKQNDPSYEPDLNNVTELFMHDHARALCEDNEIAVPVNITRADQDTLRPKEETTR
jgi:hypothetical protein